MSLYMLHETHAQLNSGVVGSWVHETSGIRTRIAPDYDITFSNLPTGRIASTNRDGSNMYISGPGYRCYYYVNQISGRRMSWQLYADISNGNCPGSGVFSKRDEAGPTD